MTGYGYGKVILFGEHFVVYGLPGIAGGIGSKTVAKAEKSKMPGLHVIDKRPAVPGYKEDKAEQFKESIRLIREAIPRVQWDVEGITITLSGDLVAASGIGASAAACAAIARAVSEFFSLNLTDEEINEIAFEGEKGYHGTPSGIDNTCATYGTLVIYRKKKDGNEIQPLELDHKTEIVMANTGIPVNTKKVVDGVRERREKEPELFEKIFSDYENIFDNAVSVIKSGSWKMVGELMDKNQELLRQIGVSHPSLEELIKTAKDNGAYGAKLTGGGAGGYMVALTPGKELQDRVAAALSKKSTIIEKATIGVHLEA